MSSSSHMRGSLLSALMKSTAVIRALPGVFLAVAFTYLGISPLSAAVASLTWLLVGGAGSRLIEAVLGGIEPRHRWLVALGPGPLLGLGLVVFIYLFAGGGLIGMTIVAATVIIVNVFPRKADAVDQDSGAQPALVTMLFGVAFLANSKEFPNLLVPALGVIFVGVVLATVARRAWRLAAFLAAVAAVVFDVATRPQYWWWSSDDTTTLSAIGTMVIERGNISDLSGWRTASHHWLLHAWLALWNQFSSAQIFQTYLITWPLVAAIAMLSSLALVLRTAMRRELTVVQYSFVAIAVAGLVQLEWPAPQEQQPFLFAMIACCFLWLDSASRPQRRRPLNVKIGGVVLLAVVAAQLLVLKPSLLVAFALLILGTVLVHIRLTHGTRLALAIVVSVSATLFGLGLMAWGGSWVSQRSFTSFDVRWFSKDLGWCRDSSLLGSLACVLSLQVVLFVAVILSAVVCLAKPKFVHRESLVVLLPLALAYLPLRYLISSGVGSGAPSFYRLSEMALMVFVAVCLATVIAERAARKSALVVMPLLALAVVITSRSSGEVSDAVASFLVSVRPLRYLSAEAVISLSLALAAGLVLARTSLFGRASVRFAVSCFCVVSFLSTASMVVTSATTNNDPVRSSRPSDFGPTDIEEVAQWLDDNTENASLFATNFLCPPDRLVECTGVVRETNCPRIHPTLMASWALTALSKREFLYLSQNWDRHTLYYFIHKTSTRLGREGSLAASRELQDVGVNFYVASREHTNPKVWPMLRDAAEFSTEHFAVVSITKLAQRLGA